MPFWTSETDTSFPPHVRLESVSPKRFRLLTPFTYVPLDKTPHVHVHAHPEIPTGVAPSDANSTDLASVPPLLWGLLASYGRQLRAALLHDQLCNAANKIKDSEPANSYRERRRADGLFQMAMRDPGDKNAEDVAKRVAWGRSWIFYAGVSFGRYWSYRKIRAALMTGQVVIGMVAAYEAIPRFPHGLWMRWLPSFLGSHSGAALVFAILLAASVCWGRDWKVPFIGMLVAPVVVPVLAVTLLANRIMGIPDWIASSMKSEPPANWGPTVLK